MGVHCHLDPAEYQHSSPGEGCTGWHHCLICALLQLTHTYQTQTNPFTATPFCSFPRPCMQLNQDLSWRQRASASCFYCVLNTEVGMSIVCNLGLIHIKNCVSTVCFFRHICMHLMRIYMQLTRFSICILSCEVTCFFFLWALKYTMMCWGAFAHIFACLYCRKMQHAVLFLFHYTAL